MTLKIVERTVVLTIFIAVLVALLPSSSFAQQISGDLVGTVTDSSGAIIPNATVEVENIATGFKVSTKANDSGEYRFSNLPVGKYNITSTANGLSAELRNFNIELNKTATAPLTMNVSAGSTTIEVTEQTVSLDTTTAQIQNIFEAKQAQDLPQASRGLGVLNLSLLSAGVASNGGLGAGTGPSVGGQRPRNNNFVIEGIDNNNKSVTGPLVKIPNDAVSNFTVLQNQFTPEFGHSSGGQFNTVILGGTNNLHGRAYEYFQNRNLNAMDASDKNSKLTMIPRYDNNRFGGQLGGPIVKDKLFFFGNYEYNPLGQGTVSSSPICAPTAAGYATLSSLPGISKNNLAILQKYDPAAPQQGGSGVCAAGTMNVLGTAIPIGTVSIQGANFRNNSALVGSVDWNLSERDQLRFRYVFNKLDVLSNVAALPAFYLPVPTRYHLINITEYHTFSSGVANEFRVGYNRYFNVTSAGNFQFPGLDSFPNLQFSDLNLQIGPNPNAPQKAIQNLYQGTDNISWSRGSHTIKIGVEYHQYISPQSFIQRSRGDYQYTATDLYLQDEKPNKLGQRSTGNPTYYGNQYAVYSYFNDTWRVRQNVTLNLGLRHEYTSPTVGEGFQAQNIAASVPGLLNFSAPTNSKRGFAPRIGLVWSPGASQATSIRAGFGTAYDVFYDNIGITSLPPQLTGTQNVDLTIPTFSFLANGGLLPGSARVFTDVATQRAATSSYLPPNRKLPYTESWNLGVEHLFAKAWATEVRYVGTRGLHLNVQSQINRRAEITGPSDSLPLFAVQPSQSALDALPLTLAQIKARGFIVPAYAAAGFSSVITPITSDQPYGDSYYHALQAQLTRRFENGLQFEGAYTWSHTIDNATADFNSTSLTPRRPQDFQNFRAERSTSALDRRHRLTISPIYDLPFFQRSNAFLKNVIGNWEIAPVYTFESPEAATVQSGIDANQNGDSAGDRAIFNPNGVPGTGSAVITQYSSALCPPPKTGPAPKTCPENTVGYLIQNPNAQYIAAGLGVFTNSSRNTISTRRINNWDLTVVKRISVTESKAVEFQAQGFNIFNHAQYIPGSINTVDSISTTQTAVQNMLVPGQVTFNRPDLTFGSNPRTMQLVLKLLF